MNRCTRKVALLAALALVGLLTVGTAAASACGGGGGMSGGGVSASALVTQAAKQLNVTRAKLKGTIVDAADARIDDEVASGDVDSSDAADLNDRIDDDLAFAIQVSRTKTVAANLGITVAALNDGFRAARKTLILAKIDKAVANGDLTADQATELKAELDDADLPGYKAFGFSFDLYGGRRSDHQSFRR
jgi:hypothetical protein